MNENYNGVGFVPGNRFSDTIDSKNKRPFRGWALDEDILRSRLEIWAAGTFTIRPL
jgi:hypothetical protein